jgi:SAM-dependent methyltransferase
MLRLAGARPTDSLIDIGGGSASLIDVLLERGFNDLTVLDISETGLRTAQQRLGLAAERVSWVIADILSWQPRRRYRIWHDRAVFHFLTDTTAQQRYLDTLAGALKPGGRIVLGTFAADGPQSCSGLPVARYSPDALTTRLGSGFTVLAADREEHHTPHETIQPFTWLLAQRDAVSTAD